MLLGLEETSNSSTSDMCHCSFSDMKLAFMSLAPLTFLLYHYTSVTKSSGSIIKMKLTKEKPRGCFTHN